MSSKNDITGDLIMTKIRNQDAFIDNFQRILDGSAAAEAAEKQQVTMYPVTIKIPQNLYKQLQQIGIEHNKSVERVAQDLFFDYCTIEKEI